MATMEHITEFELRKDRRFMRVEGNKLVRKRRKRRSFLKLTLSFFLCAALIAVAMFALKEWYLHLITSTEYDVRTVSISGCVRTSSEDIEASISHAKKKNIFTVDLEALKKRLKENNRWIEDASMKKRLPSTIEIEVKERVPVALFLWHGRIFLVDGNAVPIDEMKTEYAEYDFPILTGIEARTEEETIQKIKHGIEMIDMIKQNRPSLIDMISEIECSDDDFVKVMLTDGSPVIYLDGETLANNIDNYLYIKEDITRRFEQIEYVDLRWKDRVVVKPLSFVR